MMSLEMTMTMTTPSLALRQVLLLHTLRIFAASGCETLEFGLGRSQSLLMPPDHPSDRGPLLGDFGERKISIDGIGDNFDGLEKARHRAVRQIRPATPGNDPIPRPKPTPRKPSTGNGLQQELPTRHPNTVPMTLRLQGAFARSQPPSAPGGSPRAPYYPIKLVNSKQHYIREGVGRAHARTV